jgi:hypothetical protein
MSRPLKLQKRLSSGSNALQPTTRMVDTFNGKAGDMPARYAPEMMRLQDCFKHLAK